MVDNQGVELDFHAAECALWYDEECDCFVKDLDNYMLAAELDERDGGKYEYWEEEVPIRQSKSQKARDKMPKHGRSLFEIVRYISRKGKK